MWTAARFVSSPTESFASTRTTRTHCWRAPSWLLTAASCRACDVVNPCVAESDEVRRCSFDVCDGSGAVSVRILVVPAKFESLRFGSTTRPSHSEYKTSQFCEGFECRKGHIIESESQLIHNGRYEGRETKSHAALVCYSSSAPVVERAKIEYANKCVG